MPNLGPAVINGQNLLSISVPVTSTSYSFTDAHPVGLRNQLGFTVTVFDLGGATSFEFKVQGSQTESGPFNDAPFFDIANITTVSNEAVCPVRPFVHSMTVAQRLGPFPVIAIYQYYRIAYKITGAGSTTAQINVVESIV